MQPACFDPVLIANSSPLASASPAISHARTEPSPAGPDASRTSSVSNSRPDHINDNTMSKIKFFKEGGATPPEGSPTSRLSGSPVSFYPAFKPGAVQASGPAPPPAANSLNGSPFSMSPPQSGASFAMYGGETPGSKTPGGYTPVAFTPTGYTPGAYTPGGQLKRANSAITLDASPMKHGVPRSISGTPRKFGGPAASPNSRRRTETKKSNSRIDPEQVPRPVGQPEAVKQEGGKVYETTKYHVPPAATAVCTVVDCGSSSCEFIRSTVNQVPAYPSTANTAHIPMAVVCQPFAELTAFEADIPCVDLGESGPFRCNRCKAYVNPFFLWHNSGKEATCNFCGQRVEVPLEYMCNLDEKGQRVDKASRPELNRGTVDYVAPSDYSETAPVVPATIFVIEATQRSLQCGLLPQVMWTLRSLLGFMEKPSSRIGILLFDHALHFFAFYPGLDCARQITVSDTEDPFAPCGAEQLLVDAEDPAYRSQIDTLLDELPGLLCAEGLAEQAAGCAALKAATELLGSRGGGHVIMFHASLPNSGIGALRHRDDIKLASEPEGGGLFSVQQPTFFEEIGADCLNRGVAVSVFCAPATGIYIDMATLCRIPRRTGGEICYYPGFDPSRDGERLHYDLSRTVVQQAVFSVMFKLRVSKGLAVDSIHSTWDPEVIDPSTFSVSRMSVDATADFVLVHGERIEGQKNAYVQVACLYTDKRGKRLIRVHTLQLPLTSSLSNVFRYTEIDAVTNLLLKQAADSALSGNGSFKDKLTKSCVDMLHAYRANCASMTAAGQLILPESLKLLPLYIGTIRKFPAFRAGSDIKVDDRIVSLIRTLGLPVGLTAPLVYPRVYTMLPLPDKAGLPTGIGDNVFMPPTIAGSSDKLATDRIYLIDNGISLRLYVRPEVCQETLYQVFGAETLQDVATILSAPEAYVDSLSEDAESCPGSPSTLCFRVHQKSPVSSPPLQKTVLVLSPPTSISSATSTSLFKTSRIENRPTNPLARCCFDEQISGIFSRMKAQREDFPAAWLLMGPWGQATYERSTELEFRDASEVVNRHVVWVALFIMAMEGGLVMWQVGHLREFFRREKLIV
ncbi:SEC24C [Symbiodinium sp. CCMP2592]|nr:SEC24C [Symbiodinium sp. CCMP2592]